MTSINTMPGGVPIPTAARVAAVDLMVEEFGMLNVVEGSITAYEQEMFLAETIDRVANECEEDRVDMALRILSPYIDLTGAYRVIAVLHTGGMKG